MPGKLSAEARAFRAGLARRRARLVTVCVAILVSIVGVTLWILRPSAERAARRSPEQMLALEQTPDTPDSRTKDAPHTGVLPNPYSDQADAHADISTSLTRARSENKRVLLDFGGNWCGDCQVLDVYFHQSPNLQLLQQSFLLVHVNVGQFDHNTDIADRYGVPLDRGIPALVVLGPDGRELFAQQTGQFERMSRMDPASVTAFLEHWKA